MRTVIVQCRVKPGSEKAFAAACLANARASVAEPGVERFDVLADEADPTRFTLVEVYRDAEAPARHKASAHYLAWRDAVEPMMAEPRQGRWHASLFRTEEGR
jgi:quinol monooxygenase YgiN